MNGRAKAEGTEGRREKGPGRSCPPNGNPWGKKKRGRRVSQGKKAWADFCLKKRKSQPNPPRTKKVGTSFGGGRGVKGTNQKGEKKSKSNKLPRGKKPAGRSVKAGYKWQ